ncbi:hypothetical protein FOMPIDRAFT_1033484 [Fomitopsis schrenkii]|uniref:Protein-S-isoprenylcysteine O-methyltransferase n=1 Tax=Fomitopsis schrenkii TaxID=2126942 RepID=S8DKK7_FOMSC|nr:hypothetical protein FOMPIDRAFT_1033484 [Fomitopsis schrenkii]
MSIPRLPLLFCAALANSIAFTPPGPPPNRKERMRHTSAWERVFNVIVPHLTRYMKNIGWVIFAGEATAVLASYYPSFPPSQYILRLLTHLGLPPSPNTRISPSLLLGTALAVTGAVIRTRCYRALGRFFTFQLALRRAQGQRLCTAGPYAVVRHPSYSGLILTIAAFALWTAGPGSWLRESGWLATPIGRAWFWAQNGVNLYAVGSLLLRTRVEDEALRDEFVQEWEHWASEVPYKILPWIF